MFKHILLVSGGLDSTALYLYLRDLGISKNDILGIHLNIRSKQNEHEIEAIKQLSQRLGLRVDGFPIDLKFGKVSLGEGNEEPPSSEKEMSKVIVPFRNAFFLSAILNKVMSEGVSSGSIYLGANPDDRLYPDCTPLFIEGMNKAIVQGTDQAFNLKAPFINWSKEKIVEIYKEREDILWNTYSCYAGRKYHCGQCVTCIIRQRAIVNTLGIDADQTVYEKKYDFIDCLAEKLEAKFKPQV